MTQVVLRHAPPPMLQPETGTDIGRLDRKRCDTSPSLALRRTGGNDKIN
jgi:hypothetical protein